MATQTSTPKLNSVSCLFFDYKHKLDNGLERAVSTPRLRFFSHCCMLKRTFGFSLCDRAFCTNLKQTLKSELRLEFEHVEQVVQGNGFISTETGSEQVDKL